MTLTLEALSFYVHALDRFSCRPNNDSLREAIVDLIAHALAQMFAEILSKLGTNCTTADALQTILQLSSRYNKGSTLMGLRFDDDDSVLCIAASAIAEDLEYPRAKIALVPVIRTSLINGLVELNLNDRVPTLESALK